MKCQVDIKELHSVSVMVEVPDGSNRDDILKAANQYYQYNPGLESEFYCTLDKNKWTVRDRDGNFIDK